jgi:hypothetical protein
MMSQRSKRELAEAIRPRYLKANREGKKRSWMSLSQPQAIIANTLFKFSDKAAALPKG